MALDTKDATGAISQLKEPLSVVQQDLKHATQNHELGFVSSFYQECQRLLWRISKSCEPQHIQSSKRKLQEIVARFVLWGSGWTDGRLDFCLDNSIDLRNNVTELLSGFAKALLQCMYSSHNLTGGHWLTDSCSMHVFAGTVESGGPGACSRSHLLQGASGPTPC
jgi:hypothetical protein